MHLQHQVGACLDPLGDAGRPLIVGIAGRVHHQQIAGGKALRDRHGEGLPDRFPFQPLRPRLADVDHGMVDRGAIARPHLHLLNPAVFSEVRRQNQILIIDRALGRNVERSRHFKHFIGRSYIPALRPLAWRRSVLGIAGGRARVHPRCKRVNLCWGQRSVVTEVSVARIGEPRRHFARDHFFANRLGPRTRVRVSEERHGRDFARTVALLAMRLEDRKNVFVENRPRKGRRTD